MGAVTVPAAAAAAPRLVGREGAHRMMVRAAGWVLDGMAALPSAPMRLVAPPVLAASRRAYRGHQQPEPERRFPTRAASQWPRAIPVRHAGEAEGTVRSRMAPYMRWCRSDSVMLSQRGVSGWLERQPWVGNRAPSHDWRLSARPPTFLRVCGTIGWRARHCSCGQPMRKPA